MAQDTARQAPPAPAPPARVPPSVVTPELLPACALTPAGGLVPGLSAALGGALRLFAGLDEAWRAHARSGRPRTRSREGGAAMR